MQKHIRDIQQFKELSPSQIFALSSLLIQQAQLDIYSAIKSAWNWSVKSQFMLQKIYSNFENGILKMSDAKFAANLYPNENSECARRKFARLKLTFKIDLKHIGNKIKIRSGYMTERNGHKEFFPTVYQDDGMIDLITEIISRLSQSGILEIADFKRRKIAFFKLVKTILVTEHGIKPVPQGAHKEQRPAVAGDRADRVDKLRRQPNEESWNDWLNRTAEEYAHKLSETGGVEKRSRIKQMLNMVEMVEVRDRDITERATANGNGHKQVSFNGVKTAGRIKLNGGQPR